MVDGEGRKFRIVTYQSKRRPTPTLLELTDLVDLYTLLQHEEVDCVMPDGTPGCRGKVPSKQEPCPQKDGLAWSPGFISAESGKTRGNKAVEGLDFAVFDIDGIDWQALEALVARLEGYEVFIHSTHTHLDPNIDRSAEKEHRPQRNVNVRLVMPFSRTVTPDEWKILWPAIQRHFNFQADKGTKDPSRLSFCPRALRGRPYLNERQQGVFLDPKPLLVDHVLYSRDALLHPTVGPAAEAAIDLKELKKHLRAYSAPNDPDGEKAALVQRLIDEEPFAFKGSRGKTTTIVGGILGKLMPHGTPVEAVLELIRPSLAAATDIDDGPSDGIEPWSERIANYYQLAQEEKETELAAEQSAIGRLAALRKKRREEAEQPGWTPPPPATAKVLPFTPLSRPAEAPPVSNAVALSAALPVIAERSDNDWREKLVCTVNNKGIAIPRNIAINGAIVLENHAAWRNVLRYNDITNDPEVHGGPLPMKQRVPEQLTTAIRFWLVAEENLDLSQSEVENLIEFVARHNHYDPVSKYLLDLRWDGTPRLNDWLIRYGNARLVSDNGLDVLNYVKTVGRKWMMAAVARGLHPGCKADNVLVLEGDQYIGKSAMLDILGGEWFADTKLSLGDKSTLELTSKSWIIEMSELATMKKSETEAQKGFFSTRVDHFRLSYGRRVRPYRRRCVFAGTTNEKNYLIDATGNRRFWTVWCDRFDLDALRADRDQLWAEAVACVVAGYNCPDCRGLEQRCPSHRWWMDLDETAFNEKVTVSRLRHGELADMIYDWWLKKDPPHRASYVTAQEILSEVMELKVDQLERQHPTIGLAVKTLGFEKTRLMVHGKRRWVYTPSDKLREATRDVPPPRASAPAGGKHDRSTLLHLIAGSKAPEQA